MHSTGPDLDIAQAPVAADAACAAARARPGQHDLGKIAKDVFDAMWAGEGDADAIIEAPGSQQISDAGAIEKIVDEVLPANAAIVAEVQGRQGKGVQRRWSARRWPPPGARRIRRRSTRC